MYPLTCLKINLPRCLNICALGDQYPLEARPSLSYFRRCSLMTQRSFRVRIAPAWSADSSRSGSPPSQHTRTRLPPAAARFASRSRGCRYGRRFCHRAHASTPWGAEVRSVTGLCQVNFKGQVRGKVLVSDERQFARTEEVRTSELG